MVFVGTIARCFSWFSLFLWNMFPGDGTIRIWDVTDGRQQQIGHLKGHEGPVWKVDGICAVSAWDLPRLACHVEQSAIICTEISSCWMSQGTLKQNATSNATCFPLEQWCLPSFGCPPKQQQHHASAIRKAGSSLVSLKRMIHTFQKSNVISRCC